MIGAVIASKFPATASYYLARSNLRALFCRNSVMVQLDRRNAEEDKTVHTQITALWGATKAEFRETRRAGCVLRVSAAGDIDHCLELNRPKRKRSVIMDKKHPYSV